MVEKVEKWIDENNMLPQHSRVIAAVSGGADSVCLLALLLCLASARDWDVRVLHVNHLIRGDEAERDEAFVRGLCEKWGVKLTIVRENVPSFAQENGLSLEEAGRICRRGALESAAEEWEDEECLPAGSVKTAMAHHTDDNAETILHNLLRGSGLRGLGGMRAVQGRIIRPLLCLRREEIRTFLLENNIPWCEDSTNTDTAYMRNRIRNEIIPLMKKEINPGAVENIARAGRTIAAADDALYHQAEVIFRLNGWAGDNEAWINVDAFLEQEDALRSELIRIMLDRAAPGLKDITSVHFSMITGLALGATGKRADLPGGLVAGRDYDTLWLRRKAEGDICVTDIMWEPDVNGGVAGDIVFKVFARPEGADIPQNEWSKWFDYDKINGALSVRTRREGDYLTLKGGVRKSINRFFIDEKVPRDKRDEILLLAEGSHILWVTGMRISEYYKVTKETKRILQAEKKEG